MNSPAETEVEVPRVIVRDNTVPPKIGGLVHYVLADRDSAIGAGMTRPGIIVDLVDDGSEVGLVSLQVFTNGGFDQLPPVHHCKNIIHDEDKHMPGTWHWPPPRELVFKSVVTAAPESDPESVESLKEQFKQARTKEESDRIEAKIEAAYQREDAERLAAEAAEPFPVALPPPGFGKVEPRFGVERTTENELEDEEDEESDSR